MVARRRDEDGGGDKISCGGSSFPEGSRDLADAEVFPEPADIFEYSLKRVLWVVPIRAASDCEEAVWMTVEVESQRSGERSRAWVGSFEREGDFEMASYIAAICKA